MFSRIHDLFLNGLEKTNLVAQVFNPLGKPIPFFVPHILHSHQSEKNVSLQAAPIQVQDIEMEKFPEDEEPVRSSDSEGPTDPKPTPIHDEKKDWNEEDEEEEVKPAKQHNVENQKEEEWGAEGKESQT